MRFQGSYLSATERGALAEYLTGKTIEPPSRWLAAVPGTRPRQSLTGTGTAGASISRIRVRIRQPRLLESFMMNACPNSI